MTGTLAGQGRHLSLFGLATRRVRWERRARWLGC
jgi:hypothetical protein